MFGAMNNNHISDKQAGISLIIFIILLVFTMVLHPVGGSVERLINITGLIIGTHALAIFSLPFGWVGFRGVTRRIGTEHFSSSIAWGMVIFGLIAAMLAGATNGLVLPIFLQHYKDASPETPEAISPIIRYSYAVNHAFDYVYTGAFCFAILGWSIDILRGKKLPAWLGWLGLLLFVGMVALLIGGMNIHHLSGFRIFVTSILVWILLAGILLCRR